MNFWLFIISALALGGVGCSSSSGAATAGAFANAACHGPGCGTSSSGGTSSTTNADASAPSKSGQVAEDADAGPQWSALCGPMTGGCLPGDTDDVCSDGSTVAATSESDAGAESDSTVAVDAGEALTCRIRKVSSGNNIERVCESAGTGIPGSACLSTLNCGARATCVSENLAPVCRRYCCDSDYSCPNDTYCTTRTTHIDSTPSAQYVAGAEVPVCVPADNCNLSEPFPCPAGQSCTCSGETACMVVRSGGLTTCAKPGNGKEGDRCVKVAGVHSCAAGYVCLYSRYVCLKLCRLGGSNGSNGSGGSSGDCASGTSCQASNDVPSGWGVCSDNPMFVVN